MLEIHRAFRADALAGALSRLLATPMADPLAPEIVAVPTRGMERWLSQRLCGRLGASGEGAGDGVCANVHFPSPRRLVEDAVAAASGIDPRLDPWAPERATWPLLEVLDANLHEPWLERLASHLGALADPPDPVRAARRLGVARRLASLYARYALARPEMLRAWAAGEDVDGAGATLAAQMVWQARLWRALRERIAAPDPAQRLLEAAERMASEPTALGLPSRVCLFGLTALAAGQLRVLLSLAHGRDVHLFVLHPSPALWAAIATAGTSRRAGPPRRAEDRTGELVANDLLGSWGRDAREMQLVLARLAGGARDHHHDADHHRDDQHHARDDERAQPPSDTLLGMIQADIRANRAPPGAPLDGAPDARAPLGREDRSIQIHACHGRARQVEVLRDALAHLFSEDPTLQPRDVIVMCPDVESFAPLIQGSFADWQPPPEPAGAHAMRLRVRLADRARLSTNPLLGALGALLALADGRLTASQVLDFAAREPVRRRFDLDEEELARLRRWVVDAGIRWGLDADHRAPYRLQRLAAGTWRAGLDRLLVGVAMGEQRARTWRGVLPLDDVGSGSIELAGRLAELLARLGCAIGELADARPIAAWAAAISNATDALTATDARDGWQREELDGVLDELVAESTMPSGEPSGAEISLAEVRALLAERLAGRATRANFRTGQLTVCTLHPMRSVPHRVVCLLGLDDGAFPRRAPADGDDLMLADPLVGEADRRSEDRQQLLDALLAAVDRLLIIYTGADERTNTPQPPAVPVGELLDVIDATVRTDRGAARERVVVRHPLQPFDPRNFTQGALIAHGSWSHDQVALEGARALVSPRRPRGPFLAQPLPPAPGGLVELDALVDFLAHPMRAFLRRRLGISPRDLPEELDDALPVALDGLRRWEVGQRVLDARLAGIDARSALLAEIARGSLPPGALGAPAIAELHRLIERIVSARRSILQGGKPRVDDRVAPAASPAPPPAALNVRLTLPDGRLLSGTVDGCHGDAIVRCCFARVSPARRLETWASLLAATASEPQRALRSACVGRARADEGIEIFQIAPLGESTEVRQSTALEQLMRLIDLYDRGMCEPLLICQGASCAYASALAAGRDPVAAAREEWTSKASGRGEDAQGAHQLVFGGAAPFEELLSHAPRAGEEGPGWTSSETTRFGRLALALWQPLLERERVSRT